MPCDREQEHQTLRLLKLLAKQPGVGMAFSLLDEKYCFALKNRVVRFDVAVCQSLLKSGRVKRVGARVGISEAGMLFLKSALYPLPGPGMPDRETRDVKIETSNGAHTVELNVAESPLSRLRFRKMRDGGAYLEADEYQAGEQLRKDFERGQLQPKISASWSSPIGGSKHYGGLGSAEISDFAMDARARVKQAIEMLGPDLAGVALDICCFLKGVEVVERERRWPPRSAKLMLKTALALLVHHYAISTRASHKKNSIRAWGTSDFRPEIADR